MRFISICFLLLSLSLVGADFTNVTSGVAGLTPIRREDFNAQKSFFDASSLVVDCKITSDKPINIAVFIKDKDGRYFQSDRSWTVAGNGELISLSVPIEFSNSNWRAYSNFAKWSSMQASGIFEAGISFWSDLPQNVSCEVIEFRPEGKRQERELSITQWQKAKDAKVGQVVPVKFQLSKEYFNPFNPEEISVDCEWITPSGEKRYFPAFYNLDYNINYSVTVEETIATGLPYWELRNLAREAGVHKFRVIAKDEKSTFTSDWQEIEIADAPFKGLVQASKQNTLFFEYQNGELFYPIGLNIHSNIDYRAERQLGITPLADCGLRDFEYYFEKCSAAGINCIEIWMASWTFGIEWSSRRYDYHGVGRYNLANANKLDRLLDLANQYGILINLVWDNHGKFANNTTQEWHENPFNKLSSYVKADGGFMTAGTDNMFATPEFDKYFNRRSRYIAARYGQNPTIFSQQLWSEVDLVLDFRAKHYADGTATSWHEKVMLEYQKYTPERHLITTHVCSDYRNNMNYINLWKLPVVSHLVGDSYRGGNIPFFQQMRYQNNGLIIEGKPRLITEFGGPSSGSEDGILEADVHAGLWSSIFQSQAGAPFLWWHDFVILGNRLFHYEALSKFIQGIDFRDFKYQTREAIVSASIEDIFDPNTAIAGRWGRNIEAMTLVSSDELIGWAFNTDRISYWTKSSPNITADEYWHNAVLTIPREFKGGKSIVDFYSTTTGEIIATQELELKESLILPPFAVDIAFKIRRVK